MRYLTLLIGIKRKLRLMIHLTLLLTVVGCSSLTSHTVTWPNNLEVIKLSDGGVCLSPESAVRLAELKTDIESL